MPADQWRYEFRVFDSPSTLPDMGEQLTTLLGPAGPVTEESAVYFATRGAEQVNVKLRDGHLDVKRLIALDGALQQWRPDPPATFPLQPSIGSVLRITGGFPRVLCVGGLNALEFLEAAERHEAVRVMHVRKRRWRFEHEGVLGEIVRVCVNGAEVASLALESADCAALAAACRAAGLAAAENVSYPLLLRRLCGLLPLPAEHPARVDAPLPP